MPTNSILKIVALVGGIGWAIYLAIQWGEYFTALSALENNIFGKMAIALGQETINAHKNNLILQSIGATVLFIIGFYKNDKDKYKDENTNKANNEAPIATNQASFIGERIISNDAYKLFLVDKYNIVKNDVLNQYICEDKLFPSVDAALTHAASIEDYNDQEIKKQEQYLIESERIKKIQDIEHQEKQKIIQSEKLKEWEAGASKRRYNFIIFIVSIILILVFAVFYKKDRVNNQFNIDSSAQSFGGFTIGEPGGNFGKRKSEDRSTFVNEHNISGDGDYNINNNPIYRINAYCSTIKTPATIDGIGCQSSESEINDKIKDAIKLCTTSSYSKKLKAFEYFYLVKNNAYWYLSHDYKIHSLGLIDSFESIRSEGEERYSSKSCIVNDTSKGNPDYPIIEIKSDVNELNDDWKVLWRLSEETGDTYGYFFRSNSEVDKKIQDMCPLGKGCQFKLEAKNLDFNQVRSAFAGDLPEISSYEEILEIYSDE